MAVMAQIDPGLQKEPRKIKIPDIYSNNEKFKSKWAWSGNSQVKQIKEYPAEIVPHYQDWQYPSETGDGKPSNHHSYTGSSCGFGHCTET